MSKLVWLHLSDIHFLPDNEWQDSTARAALLDFLARQLAKHQLKVDLIFCTGDIAFGDLHDQSLAKQYAMARQFFDAVLAVCGCDKSHLFVVPGNHDINRNSITNAEREAWCNWGSAKAASMADTIPKWFASLNADTKAAMRRLQEFGEFVADYLPHQMPATTGHHHYAQTITIAGRKIGIAGFNSAWTCAGDNDDRTLWLAAGPQFDHMRRELGDADLKIGLIHHPLDWFNESERSTIRQRIAEDAHFWLHGHTHDAWVEPLPSHVTLGAGAVTAGGQEEFGCNLVQLDLDGGKGQAHLYRYNKIKALWIEANNIAPDGGNVWRFALPTGAIKSADDSTSKVRPRRIDAAAPRYARLGSTIDVIVQVRMLSSPLLSKADFPSQEKPIDVIADSRKVNVKHDVAGQHGPLLPATVRVKLIAPLFNIAGTAEQLLEVPAAKYSELLIFLLIPTKMGECRINVESMSNF
jgi:predicted phosphodiesterase